jgi:hypothetical protein
MFLEGRVSELVVEPPARIRDGCVPDKVVSSDKGLLAPAPLSSSQRRGCVCAAYTSAGSGWSCSAIRWAPGAWRCWRCSCRCCKWRGGGGAGDAGAGAGVGEIECVG